MAENLEVKSTFELYEDFNSLPDSFKPLIELAKKASQQAYAPYSEFKVGASVLLENDQIILGSNQENAAYPSGLCAERVAIFNAASNHESQKIKAIAVIANKNNVWKAALPCGACRQVIREFETKQDSPIKIVMAFRKGKYLISKGAEDLLPLSFTKRDL